MNLGPSFYVGSNGTGDIASFYDTDSNVEVLHIGGANGSFPNVGIKVSDPTKTLTVSGEISASGNAWFNDLSVNNATFNTSISSPAVSGTFYGNGGNLTNVPHYFVTARQTGALSGSAVGNVFTAAASGSIAVADGYTPVVGDIVLYTGLGNTTPNNGPWIVTDVGSPTTKVVLTRPPFFTGTVKNGMLFTVLKGNTIQGLTMHIYSTTSSTSDIVVGTTNVSLAITYQRTNNVTTATNIYTGKQTFAVGTSALAPITFQAGTLLATPSAHHVEWDGTSMYHTTSASTRKKIVAWETVVPSTTASTGVSGQFAFDANYLYVCTTANTWRRTGLSGW
jgi:hypothetical protein